MTLKVSELGARIRAARKKAKLTQAELAERAGLPLTTLQDLEYGKSKNPGVNSLLPIAEVLNESIEDLLGAKKPTKNSSAVDLSSFEGAAKFLDQMSRIHPAMRAYVLALVFRDDSYIDAIEEPNSPGAQSVLKIARQFLSEIA